MNPTLLLDPSFVTGEARTDAFVQAHGGSEAVFESFVEPASLILSTLLKSCIPDGPVLQASEATRAIKLFQSA